MSVGSTSYTYDAENRMTAVSRAATATFVYDGDGNRVKGVVGGVTTTYIGNYFEWTGSTTTMKKYYYAGGTRVAEREGSTLYWLLSDHLGSTNITAYSSGGKKAELRYKAWGETRYSSGSTPTTFRYTGQREESSLGLYWYASRWYSASLGRFVSPDSIIPQPGNPQAWDRYSYVYSNPVNGIDPTGHKACEWDGNGNCIRDPDWEPGLDTAIVAQPTPIPASAVAPVAQNPILDTYNAVNWNLQAPGEINIYTTPFFQPFGGLRVYVTGETTVDHNSTITLGTGSTQIGPLEVSPTSISYQMGESSLDKAGSYITGTSVDLPLDPWAIKVENDITVRKGTSSVTLTFGVEFLARPDNLTPPTLFAGLPFFGYGLWHNLTMMGSIGGNNTCMIPGLC